MDRAASLDETLSRQAIAETLARYARGVDRVDVALLKSAYWPEAVDDHGTFNGPAMEFADYLGRSLHHFLQTVHAIGNVHIQFDGDRARVESYVSGFYEVEAGAAVHQIFQGGRYLDAFERRGGEWRIIHRRFVMDWVRRPPQVAHLDALFAKHAVGARGAADPSAVHLSALT